MLFSSYTFILVFLPLTLAAFAAARRYGAARVGAGVLVAASLIYYGWWNPIYLWLIGGSILVNFAVAGRLSAAREAGRTGAARGWLAVGVVANLAPLTYYKYAAFLAETAVSVAGLEGGFEQLALPLGISFFTFQQIAYLVDVRRGIAHETSLLRYALFVTFFPQLIAGPIVHHGEMLPQFRFFGRLRWDDLSVGATLFTIGLFKKVCIADSIAPFANEAFAAAGPDGAGVDLILAWQGALAYTFQLYFDFSGYSDMAIGAARLFGIRLPMNFNAPYRAHDIIDFWRRWHITLSRFLRDYLYIPLGGNRLGPARRHGNLMVTMLLGGLWHGAGWTFVLWGGLHGVLLVLNHAWNGWRRRGGRVVAPPRGARLWTGRAVTFIAVLFAWVAFRAPDMQTAGTVWAGMIGLHGVVLPQTLGGMLGPLAQTAESWGVAFAAIPLTDMVRVWGILIGLLAVCWLLPTPYEILRAEAPALGGGSLGGAAVPDEPPTERPVLAARLTWRPSVAWAAAVGLGLAVSLLGVALQTSEFLYYDF